MAKARATPAKKIKDKWKAKQWYTVKAPKMFNEAPLAETLADEPEKLIGRIAESTLQELTGDFTKMHVKVYFKVKGFVGTEAHTKFDGHELTSDYIRRLTRRKNSKLDSVIEVTTKDGYGLRVKPLIVTDRRCRSSQLTAIRHAAENVVIGNGKDKALSEFVRDILSGELSQAVYREARKVYPLKRVELRRSEVFATPEVEPEQAPVFPSAAREAPAEAEAAAEAGAATPEAEAVTEAMTEEEGGKPAPEEELSEEERL
ncbi:MAG: 30S ribosomal protein S3ae [Methanobacteriota archaeon]